MNGKSPKLNSEDENAKGLKLRNKDENAKSLELNEKDENAKCPRLNKGKNDRRPRLNETVERGSYGPNKIKMFYLFGWGGIC